MPRATWRRFLEVVVLVERVVPPGTPSGLLQSCNVIAASCARLEYSGRKDDALDLVKTPPPLGRALVLETPDARLTAVS